MLSLLLGTDEQVETFVRRRLATRPAPLGLQPSLLKLRRDWTGEKYETRAQLQMGCRSNRKLSNKEEEEEEKGKKVRDTFRLMNSGPNHEEDDPLRVGNTRPQLALLTMPSSRQDVPIRGDKDTRTNSNISGM